jgi:hypothetical protein
MHEQLPMRRFLEARPGLVCFHLEERRTQHAPRAVGRHFDKVDLALSDSADSDGSYRPPWPLRARSTRAINSRGLKGLVT